MSPLLDWHSFKELTRNPLGGSVKLFFEAVLTSWGDADAHSIWVASNFVVRKAAGYLLGMKVKSAVSGGLAFKIVHECLDR